MLVSCCDLYSKSPPEQPKMPKLALSRPQKLAFNVSPDIEKAIDVASESLDA